MQSHTPLHITYGLQVKLTPEFRKQIVRLKKGLPACASPMKRTAPLATTPSKGEGLKPQPQSSPRAVVGTPGKTAVAQLVGSGPLGYTSPLGGATAWRSGLFLRARDCSTHSRGAPNRADRQEWLRHHR